MKTLNRRRVLAIATTVGLGLAVISVLFAQPPKQPSAATNEKMLVRETSKPTKAKGRMR
jgi:hypothetical protein